MKYFQTIGTIYQPVDGNYVLMTNLMSRAKVIGSIAQNPLVFYKYDIQEGDTPETIASKYYDDSYRYWIVLYFNELMDPFWDWPMPQQLLDKYIDNKYMPVDGEPQDGLDYAMATIYEYRKITTKTDNESGFVTTEKTPITSTAYAALAPSTTTYEIPGGTTCTIQITKTVVTMFDYEIELNESRRQIRLLKSEYASVIEQNLAGVMNG